MRCNVGKTDRLIRAVLGMAIISLGFYYNNLWGAIGLIPLLTAAIGWCPAYIPIGLSTCKVRQK